MLWLTKTEYRYKTILAFLTSEYVKERRLEKMKLLRLMEVLVIIHIVAVVGMVIVGHINESHSYLPILEKVVIFGFIAIPTLGANTTLELYLFD